MQGDKATVFLVTDTAISDEIGGQLLSVAPIVSSKNVISAITMLYHDPNQDKGFKRGAGGKNEGSARRFRDVFWQFYETYNFRTMTPTQILNLLPEEFDRFN